MYKFSEKLNKSLPFILLAAGGISCFVSYKIGYPAILSSALFILLVELIGSLLLARVLGKGFLPIKSWLWGVSFVLMLCGIVLFIYNWGVIDESWRRQFEWKKTTAVVTKASIQGIEQPDALESQISKGAILPLIEYRYEIDKKEYLGSSHLRAPSFGQKSSRIDVARKSIKAWPVDKEFEVFYNPELPSESMIYPAPTWRPFTQMGFGMTLWSLGFLIFFNLQLSLNEQSKPKIPS